MRFAGSARLRTGLVRSGPLYWELTLYDMGFHDTPGRRKGDGVELLVRLPGASTSLYDAFRAVGGSVEAHGDDYPFGMRLDIDFNGPPGRRAVDCVRQHNG